MAFTRLASTAKSSADTNAVTTTAIDTTGANLLVLISACEGGGEAISDNKGNSWTALTSHANSTAQVRIYYSIPTSVGSGHTFTSSLTGGFPAVAVSAYSGAATSSVFDKQNGAASDSASSLATGSVSPSADGELLISGLGLDNGIGTLSSIDSGFAIDASVGIGASDGVAIASLIQTTASAQNPTWSLTGGSDVIAVAIATFKSAPPVLSGFFLVLP